MSNTLTIAPETALAEAEELKTKDQKEFDEDFDRVRGDLIEVLGNAKDGMEYYIEIAKQDSSPRAFEVLGKLVDTVVAANEKLIDIHKKRREINIANAPVLNNTKIGNAIIVGSTTDLQKLIAEQRKNNIKTFDNGN